MNTCPCGSTAAYRDCCGPYLSGQKSPVTALELMKSRYTAYVKKDINYLFDTHLPETRRNFVFEALAEWARSASWLGLTIISVRDGREEDSSGTVEFEAAYEQGGKHRVHRERSRFLKKNGLWYYETNLTEPEDKGAPQKTSRNGPCPCGSGKKYKKCCGADT